MKTLQAQKGMRLFRYMDGREYHEIESADINTYLHELAGAHITAKDFRTWGGTLLAFHHLIETENREAAPPKADKVRVQAAQVAANVLGNTRSVARSSYIHPDILSTYGTKDFARYYAAAQKKRRISGLDQRETELLGFLEQLFAAEFKLIRTRRKAA